MIEAIIDKKSWNECLLFAEHLDFYHTYDYHCLSKNADEIPILIKYTAGSTSLALPLLVRTIENSDYKDAISVYGYAGILTLSIDAHFNKEDFHKELNAFFNENKIISVFSRLHPYLKHQEALLGDLGTISALGKVVYIDLQETLEEQRKMYNRRMKTYLNKSRRFCTIIESKCENQLDAFIHLYHENMKRVDANSSYFFEDNYFRQLLASKDFTTKLVLCIHDETEAVIAGALFIEKGTIVQYHLSCLNEDYSNVNPVKLIIDEMRIKYTRKPMQYLNLGGGIGSTEDSLFSFKSSFSKNFREFKIWKYVVNEVAYNVLTKKHFATSPDRMIEETNFFPAYRSNNIYNK